MNAIVDKDFDALYAELDRLRSHISKLSERLSDAIGQTGRTAKSARRTGKRAWTLAGDEADLLMRRVEEYPIASAALVLGGVAIILGLVFARRL